MVQGIVFIVIFQFPCQFIALTKALIPVRCVETQKVIVIVLQLYKKPKQL
jgi:hypothetical protein